MFLGKQDAVAEAGKQQPQGKGNRKGGKLQEELLQAELEDLLSPEEAEQMQQELEAMEEGDMDDSNEVPFYKNTINISFLT
jgi:hypothetical protein